MAARQVGCSVPGARTAVPRHARCPDSFKWFSNGCKAPPRVRRAPARLAVQSVERSQGEPAAVQAAEGGPGCNGQEAGDASNSEFWQELITTPDSELFGCRARSASDAAVLRRKGHLKEQDKFIQFMQDMHKTHTCLEVGGLAGSAGLCACSCAQLVCASDPAGILASPLP